MQLLPASKSCTDHQVYTYIRIAQRRLCAILLFCAESRMLDKLISVFMLSHYACPSSTPMASVASTTPTGLSGHFVPVSPTWPAPGVDRRLCSAMQTPSSAFAPAQIRRRSRCLRRIYRTGLGHTRRPSSSFPEQVSAAPLSPPCRAASRSRAHQSPLA
uniref:Uncharacterized protein n=1 Tax=Arundo donax TaxID=35708 RepID=A0A0A9D678_ARUDO